MGQIQMMDMSAAQTQQEAEREQEEENILPPPEAPLEEPDAVMEQPLDEPSMALPIPGAQN